MSTKPKRFIKEGTFGIYMGFFMLGSLVLAGAIIPRVSKYNPDDLVAPAWMPPSRDFFFGTDNLGRDVFVRVFDAVFIDLGTAIVGVAIPLIVGTIIGTLLGISQNKR